MNTNNKYQTTEFIMQLYKKYLPQYTGGSKTGLFLLPTQTGSGKTHATSKVIFETILNSEDVNIIYLINSKEERKEMYTKILSHVSNEDEKILLEKNIYMLESNEDILFRVFSQDYEFRKLNKLNEFLNLKKKIEVFTEVRKKANKNLYELYGLEDKRLKVKLTDIFKKPKKYGYSNKMLLELKEEAKILYPTIDLKSRAIITTTQKFLKKIYDVNGSYFLYDKNKSKTVIFMDEFDTQKNIILNTFIEDVAKKGLDIFELLKIISETVHVDTIDKYFNDNSYMYDLLEDINKFYLKYSLKYRIKFKSIDEHEEDFFLKDTASFKISKRYNQYVYTTNKDKSTNYVTESKTINENQISFLDVYEEADRLINQFFTLIRSLLIQNNEKVEQGSQESTDLIYNFLYEFLTGTDTQIHVIVNRILREKKKSSKHKIFQSELDKSYSNLYSMLAFRNDEKHESFTRFYNYTLDNTPDAFLSFLSKNFFVVGISATATIPSKIYNFDLEFLSDSLIVINEEERYKLKDIYHQTKLLNREYKVNFLNSFLFSSLDEMSGFMVQIGLYKRDDKFFKFIWESTDKQEGKVNYKLSRYLEFVHLYKEFSTQKDIKTFLYLVSFNFDVYEDLELLRIMLLYMLIDNLALIPQNKLSWFRKIVGLAKHEIQSKGYSLKDLGIHFAKASGNFEWKTQLKEGLITRMFLVSNYMYMSKAQNLDYPYIPIGEKKPLRKDFDAVYCGEITSLMDTKLKDEKSKEITLLKLLHNTTILQNNGEISLNEKNTFIKKVMRGHKWNKNIYIDTTDYIDACMILLIQSIGRLHRTNHNGMIRMYFHYKNKKVLEYFNPISQILLPAVEYALQESQNDRVIEEYTNNSIDISVKNLNIHKNLAYFKTIIYNPKSSKKEVTSAINEWNQMRKDLIKNPTIIGLGNSEQKYFTVESNKYWYKQENDYENIYVSNSYIQGYSEVSKEDTRLSKLYSIKELQGCFEKNEIALEFEYANMMIPIVYNNFYKGAIGEIFGKYIFEQLGKMTLIELSYESKAPFESFDFTNDHETIYIDFKYFNTFTAANIQKTSEIIENVQYKLGKSELSPHAVFVVNLFVDEKSVNEFSNRIKKEGNIYLIPWIIKEQGGNTSIDYEMLIKVRELYEKYTNK